MPLPPNSAKHAIPCRVLPADLASDGSATRSAPPLADERIDFFINNAGFGACGSFWRRTRKRSFPCCGSTSSRCNRLFKFVLKKDGGAGLWGHPERGVLRRAAAGRALYGGLLRLQGLRRQPDAGVAEELREQHSPVYVCALCPGPVDTRVQ